MNYTENYKNHLKTLVSTLGEKEAMSQVVGGDYDAVGTLEASVLETLNVAQDDTILDIGCGTGRLGFALRDTHRGKYIGTDILIEMLNYADRMIQTSDWRYLLCDKPPLPLASDSIDVACLFSVVTHLLDEDVFGYMKEVKRVLKPGAIALISYLDFSVATHWTVFERMLEDPARTVLNRFTSKDTLTVLARMSGLQIDRFWDGNEPTTHLKKMITYADGRTKSGLVGFGQSICICRKPSR